MIKEKKEGCDEEMSSLAGFDRTLLESSGSREDGWISQKQTGRSAGLSRPFTQRKTTTASLTYCVSSPLTPAAQLVW